MPLFGRRGRKNLGTVSIGSSPTVSVAETSDDGESTTTKRPYRRRSNATEAPTPTSLKSPLKLERQLDSLDGEYIELAKRYLGDKLPNDPTLVDMAKAVIRLFEDNAKLYKKLSELSKRGNHNVTKVLHSFENNSSWN